MALQTGMGLSRIMIIMGAGYTGTIILKNKKLSDILGELLAVVKAREGKGESIEDDKSDAIATQVRRLAAEVRQMASQRQITVVNPSGQIDLSSLIVPAAALGVLGYGYMWWKGLSFSDLMYVTKHSMTAAVSDLTKHLQNASKALSETKRYLAKRIDKVDSKLDKQVELSEKIRNEVVDVGTNLSKVGCDLEDLQRLVYGLDGKIMSLEEKQDLANLGVLYLCTFVDGKKTKMPEMLQEQLKISGTSRGYLTSAAADLKGLKEIADCLELGDRNGSLTDGSMQDPPDSLDGLSKMLTRVAVTKC